MKIKHSSSIAIACLWIIACCFVELSSCNPITQESEIPMGNTNLSHGVQLRTSKDHVVMDNGIVQVTLSKPGGLVIGVKYNGIDNLLEDNGRDDRGYWDIVWSKPGGGDSFDKLKATNFKVVTQDENQVELSFMRTYAHDHSQVPLNVDKRYILRRGSSGFYMYAILERVNGWPDVDMNQIRIVFKLQGNKFRFMAVSDDLQRIMPTERDRDMGHPLAYKEAVLLTHSTNPQIKGEVDDKYQYAMENKDNKVQGWISEEPATGFWMITPSQEFICGGPLKQDLTSHTGPIVLSMFTSTHYTGKTLNTEYRNGEPWKKVLGPVFIYLNSIPNAKHYRSLWNDAKAQMSKEENQWPYNFIDSEDFPSADKRGTVSGQLLIRDPYMFRKKISLASYAYVGLAAPGDVGSWQYDSKGYQFWTQADKTGKFSIRNVRPGVYNLYAWVPGFIGDYKKEGTITIAQGGNIDLGVLRYGPPRNGPTLWEIGIPDRSAAEFFVPDPNPNLQNRLFNNFPQYKYRQYGLWDRYTELYHKNDLVYTIGVSNHTRDWFFAHVPRHSGNSVYTPTTWQIKFELGNVEQNGHYTLQLALASAQFCDLEVRINNPSAHRSQFSSNLIGRDNSIARHGIHGLYRLYSIDVPSQQFLKGRNTIYLSRVSRTENPFEGILYDYIRLEGPSS